VKQLKKVIWFYRMKARKNWFSFSLSLSLSLSLFLREKRFLARLFSAGNGAYYVKYNMLEPCVLDLFEFKLYNGCLLMVSRIMGSIG
jgi:hypothetical protein